MDDYDHIELERTDGVARLALSRPGEHNALHGEMIDELAAATTRLVEDRAVRALVLTGSGDAFCTGADLSVLSGGPEDARKLRRLAVRLHATVRTLAAAPIPVVTGVNGVAAGGGLGLALVGDLVLVHPEARFEFVYPRIGLSGDGGSTYFLPRLVGLRRAMEIALLDEPISPERAVADGLATEVVDGDFDRRLAAVAADLADGPTKAYAATKRLLHRSFARELGVQLAAETDSIARLARTDDYAAGYEAFFGDDEPTFRGE
ncbi:MAG: enoyl-CoA hydratase/isomerase family protein [Halobacteriales archaeon]